MGSKRVVVKVGSNTLTNPSGALDRRFVASLVDQLAQLTRQGYHPILVTSAAIAAGIEVLGLTARPSDIPTLQACAAIGQVALIEAYAAEFGRRNIAVGQVLLTRNDTANRSAYLHARDTFDKLIELGTIPVVNENDTVAVDEIKFGDNDTLAALVATMIDADLVILLTDVDGLYDADPRKHADAHHIDVVHKVDDSVMKVASGTGSYLGSGGMRTKLEAARVLMKAGIPMVLCDGREANAVVDAVAGLGGGTRFEPEHEALSHKKRWIALGGAVRGTVVVDEGACVALRRGGVSLLPPGVVAVIGEFSAGSPVAVETASGELVARGLSAYSSAELACVAGMKTCDITEVLPGKRPNEVIHCDQLVLL